METYFKGAEYMIFLLNRGRIETESFPYFNQLKSSLQYLTVVNLQRIKMNIQDMYMFYENI